MDTFYGPLSAHIKNVQLHHIFMKTSEQPCWNNLPYMIIINEHPPLDCTSKWHFWHQFYRTFTNIILQVYRCSNIISDCFHWFRTSGFLGFQVFNILPLNGRVRRVSFEVSLNFSVTFVTIIQGLLVYRCHTLCIVLHRSDRFLTEFL